jgi:hypothetical protein
VIQCSTFPQQLHKPAISALRLIDEREFAIQTVQAIEQDDLAKAVTILRQLAVESSELPPSWSLKTAQALETGEWGVLSDGFAQQEFVGQNGYFLLIAHHRMRREANDCIRLTAIFGQVLSLPQAPIREAENLLREIFGTTLSQLSPRILPIVTIASCGNIGGEGGEAFIVPDSWIFPNSASGPALNDMAEQRRRFLGSGWKCIRRIFDPETASLLLASLEDEAIGNCNRHMEYQLHEVGHATGLGLEYKLRENLLPTYWNGAVEEWRSDGVEFEIASRLLTPEQAGQLIAVNLCLRLGLDAHRRGGPDRDTDVNATLLTLDRLFQSGALGIKSSGRLYLRDLNYQSLVQAVEPHREETLRLTREELNLDYPTGISRLYGAVEVQKATESIFKGLVVGSCQGIWVELR